MGKASENWWRQAEEDLDSAEYNLEGEKYYIASFLCQQATEKALKALMLRKKRKLIKTHNILKLARDLGLPENLLKKIATLEPVYQETRYPDVSSKIPSEEFERIDAVHFVNIAKEVLQWIRKKI